MDIGEKDMIIKTLNELLEMKFAWKETIAKCYMYTNVWYEGYCDNNDGNISIRFLYYTLDDTVTKTDLKCFPHYKKKAFPLSMELQGCLHPFGKSTCCLEDNYGIGTKEYYILMELLSGHFDRINLFYQKNCFTIRQLLQRMSISTPFQPVGESEMLYQYDSIFINTWSTLVF